MMQFAGAPLPSDGPRVAGEFGVSVTAPVRASPATAHVIPAQLVPARPTGPVAAVGHGLVVWPSMQNTLASCWPAGHPAVEELHGSRVALLIVSVSVFEG